MFLIPDYIDVPIVTDPEDLVQIGIDTIQSQFPDWVPAAGNLDTWVLEAFARISAEVRDLASQMPTSAFRYMGVLAQIPPIDAAPASGTSTWTMRDDAGYTIPAGAQVGIRVAGDTLVPFTVLADVIVPPGSTVTSAGQVVIVAIDPGAAGSSIGTPGGPVELIDTFDFVTAIVLVDVTSGGVDAETDDAFLSRLRAELQLLAPRPILPADFAASAQNIAGVDRALCLDGYNPAENEIETVALDATGGTFLLTFQGQQTGTIAYDANAAAVQTALEALSNIAPGDVIVSGGPEGTLPVTVEFTGAYAATDVTQMTADSTALTGGAHTATVATTRQGNAASTGNERMVSLAAIDSAGNEVGSTIRAQIEADLEAKREVTFEVHVIDPTYNTIDVDFTVAVADGFVVADVVAAAEAAVNAYLSPANWGFPQNGDRHLWEDVEAVRYLEVAQAINQTPGVDYITTTGGNYDLRIALHPAALARVDVALVGPAALTVAGTVTGAAA